MKLLRRKRSSRGAPGDSEPRGDDGPPPGSPVMSPPTSAPTTPMTDDRRELEADGERGVLVRRGGVAPKECAVLGERGHGVVEEHLERVGGVGARPCREHANLFLLALAEMLDCGPIGRLGALWVGKRRYSCHKFKW